MTSVTWPKFVMIDSGFLVKREEKGWMVVELLLQVVEREEIGFNCKKCEAARPSVLTSLRDTYLSQTSKN